tara:strand:+ start:12 stop:338 length:327 start_codon:yes stop_codon:yes gene_type:complete
MSNFTGEITIELEKDGVEYELTVDIINYRRASKRVVICTDVDPPDTGELEYNVVKFTECFYSSFDDGGLGEIDMEGIASPESIFGSSLDTYISEAIEAELTACRGINE